MPTNFANRKIFNLLFLWLLSFAINIIAFLLVRYKIGSGARTLALHTNVQVGVDLYGKGSGLYSLPALALALTAINAVFYRWLKPGAEVLAWLSAVASLLLQIILLGAILLLSWYN